MIFHRDEKRYTGSEFELPDAGIIFGNLDNVQMPTIAFVWNQNPDTAIPQWVYGVYPLNAGRKYRIFAEGTTNWKHMALLTDCKIMDEPPTEEQIIAGCLVRTNSYGYTGYFVPRLVVDKYLGKTLASFLDRRFELSELVFVQMLSDVHLDYGDGDNRTDAPGKEGNK